MAGFMAVLASGFAGSALAQQNGHCWYDVRSGQVVADAPASSGNVMGARGAAISGVVRINPSNPGFAAESSSLTTYEKRNGIWVNSATGEAVAQTVPASGVNYMDGSAAVRFSEKSRNQARNGLTGQIYLYGPCPYPTTQMIAENVDGETPESYFPAASGSTPPAVMDSAVAVDDPWAGWHVGGHLSAYADRVGVVQSALPGGAIERAFVGKPGKTIVGLNVGHDWRTRDGYIMGWMLDVDFGHLSTEHGWSEAIVDETPIDDEPPQAFSRAMVAESESPSVPVEARVFEDMDARAALKLRVGKFIKPNVLTYLTFGPSLGRQKLLVERGGLVSEETRTIRGTNAGLGLEWQARAPTSQAPAIHFFVDYDYTWWERTEVNGPTAIPESKFEWKRDGGAVKTGVRVRF